MRKFVTVQYLHSHEQKSIENCLRQWDFCLPAHVFLRSAQQVRRPIEQLPTKNEIERLTAFWKAIEVGDTEGIVQYLNRVLSNSISVFDTKARKEEKESSYHNLLVGILTGNADWLVKSNVEAGAGFADIVVETDDPDAGIVVDIKYTKSFDEMETACKKALDQIQARRYQDYLINDDRKDIHLYGITFCKKRCRAITEVLSNQ